jgi:hypothetical protein
VHFKDIREQDFLFRRCLWISQQIGSNTAGLAWIDVAFLFAPGRDPVFLHDTLDPILAHLEQGGEFAMSQGIILLMPLLNVDCHLLIFHCLLSLKIEAASCHA